MKVSKEKVRDGYFKDLPSDLQKKILDINKMIIDTIRELVDDDHYEDLKSSRWAMSCIDDFCTVPSGKGDVGSARVYESKYKGKLSHKCMIQITGHFNNPPSGWIEMLLHELISHTFSIVRPKVRRKYDITMDNEGGRGEVFEGFDIYPDKKTAGEIWELFGDKPTRTLTEEGLLLDEYGDIIFEKSHGKLKYDFRLATDIKTGHDLKIVYSLDGSKYEDVYGTHMSQILRQGMTSDQKLAYNRKYGDIDHLSSDQKVLAIIDLNTGQKLKEVDCKGIYGSNNSGIFRVKVGEVEKIPNFKSTYFRKTDHTNPYVNPYTDDLVQRERFGKGRGHDFDKSHIDILDIDKEINEMKFIIKHCNDESEKKDHEDELRKLYAKKKELNQTITTRASRKDPKHSLQESTDFEEGWSFKHNNDEKQAYLDDLPYGLVNLIKDTRVFIKDSMKKIISENVEFSNMESVDIDYIMEIIFNDEDPTYGNVFMKKEKDGTYYGNVSITVPLKLTETDKVEQYLPIFRKIHQMVWNDLHKTFDNANPGKVLVLSDENEDQYFCINFAPDYAEKLWNYLENPKRYPLTESSGGERTVPYDTDMSEDQAKSTLDELASQIIRDFKNGKENMNQYKANTIANIISRNLLPLWSNGFNKFSIELTNYQVDPVLEFKIPKFREGKNDKNGSDFVRRFVDGRERLSGFVHRQRDITIRMSPRIFHTMTKPSDCWHFFKAAIQYFDHGLDNASDRLMYEAMKLDQPLKELISTTDLCGIITVPLKLLFVWDNCYMNNKNSFKLSESDVQTVSQFMRNIRSRYKAPEQEQKAIIKDVKDMVNALHEQCDMDINMTDIRRLPEAIEEYYAGEHDSLIESMMNRLIEKQVDEEGTWNPKDPQVKYLQEKFGVKKLKKIPADTIAYITIETESIRDANDKMMIASYCLGKLEIVEWYIELLTVGSKKYVVPHTKPYLESMRTQLLACYKKIMDTPVRRPSERPLLDIQYPAGYEG